MGLDATLARIKFKVNTDLEYEEIRNKKWNELNKDLEKFYKWEDTVWKEILYTSNWDVAHIISKRNAGDKKVDFEENRDMILDKQDIECIIKDLEDIRNNENNKSYKEMYEKHIKQLEECLKATDFNKETLLYGEWF